MFKNYFAFTKSPALNFIIGLVISIGLLVGLGPLVISYGKELPFSILSFVVLFNAIWWGWQIGFLSILAYTFLGLAGFEIFYNYKSGIAYFYNDSNIGYFFGLMASSLLAGYFAEIPRKKKMLNSLALWFLGHGLIILISGLHIYRTNTEEAFAFMYWELSSSALKAAAGLIITVAFLRFVEGRENFYKAS